MIKAIIFLLTFAVVLWHPAIVHFKGAAPASKASNTGAERGFLIVDLSELPGVREALGVPLNVNTARAFLLPEVQSKGDNTMNQQKKSIQTIMPVFPDDYQIIKETSADGTVSYRHPSGGDVETYPESLDMMMGIIINRFEALCKLMDDEDYGRIGFVIEALAAGAKQEIYEVFHFLDEAVGEIFCTVVQKNQSIYRKGRIIGVEFQGKEQRS